MGAERILCVTCKTPQRSGALFNRIGLCPTCVDMTMEFECKCFMENAKDGDFVKVWWSPARPGKSTTAGFVPPMPYIPCPECGRSDRIRRMSSGGHVMRIGAADVARIGARSQIEESQTHKGVSDDRRMGQGTEGPDEERVDRDPRMR